MPLFSFEDADPSLVPMAGRRALDHAGLKLSLRAWQGLSFPVRQTLASLGEEPRVDAVRVRELVDGAHPDPTPIEPVLDPPADAPPAELSAALGAARPIDARAWAALRPLERYVLASYARRERADRLTAAYDALVATR